MLIYLAWDRSGSMAECGKRWIASGVARAIEQYLRLGYANAELRLVVWSSEARIVDWEPDQEFPQGLLISGGTTSVQGLISLLGPNPEGRVLIITDGFWSPRDQKVLKRWRESLEPSRVRFIRVGADANPHLKGKEVFAAEDLFAALDGWLQEGTR